MPQLELYEEYSRKDVRDVFAPEASFTPGAGSWGLQGALPVPDRPGDYVFFVTYGQTQGEYTFDEGITRDGVLTWQSQPNQDRIDGRVQQWIAHNELTNSIYLFLRTSRDRKYAYLGRLKYLSHDREREHPVHFKWQILDWALPEPRRAALGLAYIEGAPTIVAMAPPAAPAPNREDGLIEVPPPPPAARVGVSTPQFRGQQNGDYAAQDAVNRSLGDAAEKAVLARETERLRSLGLTDLAAKVVHVSQTEGDGAGYDIRSYDADGTVRYIEVKATRGGISTAFYLSINEIKFSEVHADRYYLHRVFEFDPATRSGKTFVIKGNARQRLQLEPISFRARV
ncbi:MAG: DUF3427 domain-containing protein [Rhodospirillales bacterium]|nr:DUF3427 domain-containing protein [Rhodospirillales bacterium]